MCYSRAGFRGKELSVSTVWLSARRCGGETLQVKPSATPADSTTDYTGYYKLKYCSGHMLVLPLARVKQQRRCSLYFEAESLLNVCRWIARWPWRKMESKPENGKWSLRRRGKLTNQRPSCLRGSSPVMSQQLTAVLLGFRWPDAAGKTICSSLGFIVRIQSEINCNARNVHV